MIYVKGYTPTWFVALPFFFAPAPVARAQRPEDRPRFELSADTVLWDEPFHVALSRLQPGQEVTIRVDGNFGAWHSQATFRSDENGRVVIPDPMKFIWSATGARGQPGPIVPAYPWAFSADSEGRTIAAATVWRRPLAPGVRNVPVRVNGLYGNVLYPPGGGRHPAIIVLGGSQGGIPEAVAHAAGLASHGYIAFALAYFNAPGLPPLLNNIPLEYFGTAIDWLKADALVDSTRIGVLGTSRGGELALILGATYASLRVVVGNVPSNVVWPGLSSDTETPAWTLNGKPLPSVPSHFTAADSIYSSRERFLRRMNNPRALAKAEIPVERINGPVLLFSGRDDQVWPSDIFAARVVDRLKKKHFEHPVELYSYENAGHRMTRPYLPTTNIREVAVHPVSHRKTMAGGTPEGQARANEDSWARLLTFLDKYLKN